jgi:mRNA-degrading endonuclease RelE of RelBE toxin-antitoxin system
VKNEACHSYANGADVFSVVFVEVPSFTKRVPDYLDDEELAALQVHMAEHPASGAVIRGSRGLRKLRWQGSGRGKRGGVRVIYYWYVKPEVITLLDIYAKKEKDDLTTAEIKQLNQLLER